MGPQRSPHRHKGRLKGSDLGSDGLGDMAIVVEGTPGASVPSAVARAASAPPVRLFGQYLIEQGVIDSSDLNEALALMVATNVTLGDLAVERGWVSRHDAEEINRLQRCIDGRWGEIALTLGVGCLTAEQIEELQWEQQAQNLRLTDALVQLGLLSTTDIETHLDRFEGAQLSSVTARLPSAWYHSAAHELLDVLPRVIARVLRSPVRFGPARLWDDQGFGINASISVTSHRESLTIGLTVQPPVSNAMGRQLGIATVAGPSDSTDLWPEQPVAEFLTLLADHVRRRIETDHTPPVQVSIPHIGDLPQRGLVFDLALAAGQAAIIIDRREANEPDRTPPNWT